MKRRSYKYGGLLFACVAFAGCSSGALSPAAGGNATAPNAGMPALSTTMPHFVQGPVHPDWGSSSMLPSAKSSKMLLYVGDDATNDVFVYDYKSRKPVGTLTGLSEPYGECVDTKGDVYVANFDGQDVVEYAHGGTNVLNTYDQSGGTPIGCAVDAKGDVAVTSFDPGEVTVYAKGNPNNGTTYSGTCYYLWTMGYDNRGNLIGVGENESGGREYCGLLFGGASMSSLSFGETIDFPGGTMWDGKYIALGDQEAGGAYQSSLIRVTLKGTTLTYVGETTLSDVYCYKNYSDVVNPFVVGKKNTPVNDKQGSVVVGANLWCDARREGVDYWHYPVAGQPYTYLNSPAEPYGAAVSIAP
jgi:hypothetical protein